MDTKHKRSEITLRFEKLVGLKSQINAPKQEKAHLVDFLLVGKVMILK